MPELPVYSIRIQDISIVVVIDCANVIPIKTNSTHLKTIEINRQGMAVMKISKTSAITVGNKRSVRTHKLLCLMFKMLCIQY